MQIQTIKERLQVSIEQVAIVADAMSNDREQQQLMSVEMWLRETQSILEEMSTPLREKIRIAASKQ